MAFLQELADLTRAPKSEAEIDALMTAAAPAPAPAPDASSSDDDGAVEVRASSDDDERRGEVGGGRGRHGHGRQYLAAVALLLEEHAEVVFLPGLAGLEAAAP